MSKITSFKKRKQLVEFALASSKSYKGMSKQYLSASIREGEMIFDALKNYMDANGKAVLGHLLVLNDLDLPQRLVKKYPNIQFRITGQFTSQFRAQGDDTSWHRNKILKNPIKTWVWQYKNAFKDIAGKEIGKKVANQDWKDYNPVIQVGTVSKASFVQEWIRFKQRAINETYYYMSHINPKTYNIVTRNRAILFLRGLSIVASPFVSIPLNISLTLFGSKMSYDFVNDPLEAEVITANFIEMKRTMGQFNKNYFIEQFGKRIVSKAEFIEKMVKVWNFQVALFNSSNKERFDDYIYYEYKQEMGA